MKKRLVRVLITAVALACVICLFSCSNGCKHEFSDWDTDTATCTEAGRQSRECSICDYVQTRKTNALGHDMVNFEDKDASCTENGYSNYVECSRCHIFTGTKTDALGHDLAIWYGSTATCTKDGVEYADCERNGCDYKTDRVSKAKGHNIQDGTCSRCLTPNLLVLIKDGKAKFKVVSTSTSGGSGKMAADSFVKMIRDLGIEIDDAILDYETSAISDCEIIIGSDAIGRGDECNITTQYLGQDGEIIKRIGNRIIIAASSANKTTSLFNTFVSDYLGITENSKDLNYLEIDEMYNYEKITKYIITSININSAPLSSYELVVSILPHLGGYDTSAIDNFRSDIYNMSGYWLNNVSSSNMVNGRKYFIIRYTDDAGEDGFRAYVEGNNFIVECAYKNKFNEAFAEFANKTFLMKVGDLSFDSDFTYTKTVSKVYYEDFKAVGDGVTCDYEAIYNAHVFANAGGQTVYGKAGATYYISDEKFIKSIPVKTNVDFCGATFIVNDEGEFAYSTRSKDLFSIDPTNNYRSLSTNDVIRLAGTDKPAIPIGTTSIDWLVPELKGKSLIQIYNSEHKDYIRHGSNQNSGSQRSEILIIDTDGKIADDTFVAFDYENVTRVVIYRVDDKEITIQNGNFYNICCKAIKSTYYDMPVTNADGTQGTVRTTYANKYHAYRRGFGIYRANVTIKGITHEMLDEPVIGTYPEGCGYVPDSKHANYGSRHESYPYYGFLYVSTCYNLNVMDTQLDGHTTYYEDKPATASTGWQLPNPVPMGSYDFVIENSSNITFKNVVQKSETGLGDSRYWGIMSSNRSRNLTFDSCQINRFDAHAGFWNATLLNTTIGHSFNVIGGGTLIADGVTKITGTSFISLRSDYGATFKGDMILKNCVFENRPGYNTNKGGSYKATRNNYAYLINSGFNISNSGWNNSAATNGAYWLWYFGYTCYMPQNITFENFTSYANKKTYVFNDLPDIIFEKTYVEGVAPTKDTVRYPYEITKSITYVGNMKEFEICAGTTKAPSGVKTPFTYTKLKSIQINRKESDAQ